MNRSKAYVRRSARTLLRDPAGRVLLVRSRFRREIPETTWAWFVPGGGVEPEESIRAAAVREIAEETGIVIDERDLTHLAYAEGDGQVGAVHGWMRDDIFCADVQDLKITTAGMEDHESKAFGEYRWWHVDELVATDELVLPRQLGATLIDFTTAVSPWDRPRQLPW